MKKNYWGGCTVMKNLFFKAFVPGGWGLKTLLMFKYGVKDVIKTLDIDITLSIKDTVFHDRPKDAKDYLVKKCHEFISTRSDTEKAKFRVESFPMEIQAIINLRK